MGIAVDAISKISQRASLIFFRRRIESPGEVVFISPEVSRFGYKPEDLMAGRMTFPALIHPDDYHMVKSAERDEKVALSYRVICGDKTTRAVCEFSVLGSDGKGVYRDGWWADVTGLRDFDDHARRRLDLFSASLDLIPVGVYAKDLARDEQIVLWNRKLEKLTGLQRENVVGVRFSPDRGRPSDEDFAGTGASHKTRADLGNITAEEIATSLEKRHVQTLTTTIYDNAGAPDFLIGVVRDGGEQERIEKALSESEQKYRALYNSMQEGVALHEIRYDESGAAIDYIILDVNPAYERIVGFSRDRVVGALASQVYGTGSPPYLDIYEKVASTGKPLNFETSFIPHGKTYRISVFCPGEGKFATVFDDITHRKKLEEEAFHTQKLESLGILAGGIAHDFNNILTGVLGNISLAQMDHRVSKDTIKRLKQAEKAALRAKNLTHRLLTFSKGGAPITMVTDMGPLIKKSSTFVLRGSNVRIEFNIDDDLWPAEVDEEQFGWVMENMVINADQAMPGGGIITISAHNCALDGEQMSLPWEQKEKYIEITVQDQGVGISKEHLSKIFDPFFSTRDDGSGLGLAIAYSILRKHGGHITVESHEGQGTIFHILLPAAENFIRIQPVEETPLFGAAGREAKRILLMDDEEIVRDVASEILRLMGYTVEIAVDGSEAIELYVAAQRDDRRFDAVIMDLTIPGGMGGREAVGALLRLDPHARILVSSGYSDDPVMASPEEFGFKGVIAKPYRIEQLGKALNQVLSVKV